MGEVLGTSRRAGTTSKLEDGSSQERAKPVQSLHIRLRILIFFFYKKLRALEDVFNQVLVFRGQLCGRIKAGLAQEAAQDSEAGGGCWDGSGT